MFKYTGKANFGDYVAWFIKRFRTKGDWLDKVMWVGTTIVVVLFFLFA